MANQENSSRVIDNAIQEEEIDLRQLAEVLLRRKKLIFGITLAAAIVALVASFVLPKGYEIKTVLEIGTIDVSGAPETLESSAQLKEKIGYGVYSTIVCREMQISQREFPKIKVENSKDTNIIFFSTESTELEKTKIIFEKINELILAGHIQKFEVANKDLYVQIEIKKKDTERLQKKAQSLEREKLAIESKIASLQLLPITIRDTGTQFALYDNQQQLEDKIQEIENTYQGINSNEAVISSLQKRIEQSKMTKVIQAPLASENPVSSKMLLNTVLAAVLGFFFGIFWVLVAEWWNNSKKIG